MEKKYMYLAAIVVIVIIGVAWWLYSKKQLQATTMSNVLKGAIKPPDRTPEQIRIFELLSR